MTVTMNNVSMPHCDSRILHAPGECQYCDKYPDDQALRIRLRIAFTGHSPREDERACPADVARTPDHYNAWPGNRPAPVGTAL